MDSKYSLVDQSIGAPVSNRNGNLNGFSVKRKFSKNNGVNKVSKKLKNFDANLFKTRGNNENGNENNEVETIQKQRQSLPIFACRERLIHEIKANDTILLMGETGSGKTTQIPQFLHDAGYGRKGLIAITQPRRVAAITIAKRVALEMNCELGGTVGFTVRFEDCTSTATRIRFITDGCLLREAISDRLLKNYSVIILDEAHERSINTDVLFGIVNEAQKLRKHHNMTTLKIIVMSATMDIDHFAKYFGVEGMFLEGRTYPVRIMHTKEPQSDYLHSCLVTLFEIHRESPPGHDVLIFLTGQDEIETMVQQIRQIIKKNDLNAPVLRVCPLYSQLPQNRQLECFSKMPPKTRKVIIATNIAETSITIPGIRYVIDSGYVKQRIYDPKSGIDSLKVMRISQAQSWQRCGRAGRESDGFCYRMYTRKEMNDFEKMPTPEILRSNISSVVLQLLTLNIDCRTFNFLDKPSPEALESAFKQLYILGAIKSSANPELTSLGRQMSQFPLDPVYSKLLLSASNFGCMEEILSLVAILSGENIFIKATEKRDQADLAHAKFESKFGDHLTLLNVYNAFSKAEKIKLWCHENFLNIRNLMYAQDVRSQLREICEGVGIPMSTCGNNDDQVRKCLLVGLYDNIAELQKDNFYITISSRQKGKIHPSSVLSGRLKPKYILYTEMVSTERVFFRIVTEIQLEWISELLPNYPHLNRIQNRVNSI